MLRNQLRLLFVKNLKASPIKANLIIKTSPIASKIRTGKNSLVPFFKLGTTP